ncbi:oligosaccharide flippase family protein [Candidatus Microgenomates bacterium]|nr:oligosaccharide flippase family protein [Candidatus Microgenomates bacterium]
MSEIDIKEIKRRSVSGVLALTSRSLVLQIVSFIGVFALTVFLSPEIFGVFFVVSAVVNFLNYFSDIGLAAALIQKKEKLTDIDLKTTFTIQQILVVIVVLLALFLSSGVARFYHLSNDGLWLFRSLVFAFFLSSLKTIPSIILERRLEFNRLVIPQIVETVFFYSLSVFLAWKGWGIRSFIFAVIVRGASGLMAIYLIQPWRPAFSLDKKAAKSLLSFGVPFQLNSFLALLKDDLLTIYLGRVLPFSQIGYIGWAKKWAEIPLRLVMDSIIKVTFPVYSRLQIHQEKLKKAINKALFFLFLIVFPMGIGLLFVIKPIVLLIPKYQKWEPAIISFYLFVITSLLASFSTPLTNALNAIGKIKITLKFMVFWTSLVWLLTPLFVILFGFNGVAGASLLMGLTSFLVVYIAKKHLQFDILTNILPSFLSSMIMAVFLLFLKKSLPVTPFGLFLYVFSGVIIYAGSLFFLFKKKVLSEFRSLR